MRSSFENAKGANVNHNLETIGLVELLDLYRLKNGDAREELATRIRAWMVKYFSKERVSRGGATSREDLIQSTFAKGLMINIFKLLITEDSPFETESCFWAYVKTACDHTTVDRSRKNTAGKRTLPAGSQRVPEDNVADHETPLRIVTKKELLENALDCLPEDVLAVYERIRCRQMTHRETATELEIPEGEVRNRLARGDRLVDAYAKKQSSLGPDAF